MFYLINLTEYSEFDDDIMFQVETGTTKDWKFLML